MHKQSRVSYNSSEYFYAKRQKISSAFSTNAIAALSLYLFIYLYEEEFSEQTTAYVTSLSSWKHIPPPIHRRISTGKCPIKL